MINTFELKINMLGTKMKVYLFQVDDILIDTGPKCMASEVQDIVRNLGIKRVVHTHHHEDHTGNSPWIEEQLNIPQYIHLLGVSLCQKQTRLPLYRALIWNNRKPFHPFPLVESLTTANYHFNVVHTPGHAEDHIVLIDEEKKICFSGDLYLFHSPLIHFSFESVPEIISSLKLTLSYDFKDVYCSHNGHLINGRRLLERKLEYLLKLQEKVLKAHAEGTPPKIIRKTLFPKNKLFQYVSFFENSPSHTVNSLIKESIQ
ncbi:MBL fold metallo-hydrolase [Fictibacillus aquaticus]|uniref:Metallo-beta-lactamase domain-containing protein n=1 Tax=Fictibacillus aquaticus TaxID=2021314 RepID=A0A235FEG3_9BACL|nr:MBL fold metallo-hydrolase [Fictibacillus aquaticus]OYD59334.1 hypothetical protein CGZ90_05440 [Fictibacillus aquaticus]